MCNLFLRYYYSFVDFFGPEIFIFILGCNILKIILLQINKDHLRYVWEVFLFRLWFCRKPTVYKNWINLSKVQMSRTLRTNPKNISTRELSTSQKKSDQFEWKTIVSRFVPVGICLIAVMQWRSYRKKSTERVAKQWEIDCYCMLPLRTISRWWGWLADKHLPEYLRPLVYGLYAHTFGVNLSEALHEDLRSYSSLADFFARPLKDGIRKIDHESDLVSPCDGTVLHFGTVHTGEIEQVKGVTYSLENFLGENTWNNNTEFSDYHVSLLHEPQKNHTLYQCVIYLAPGDYHRFHSPAEWTPTYRRHFHGKLLSVSPRIAKWLPGLFCLNERAVYLGTWEHGFFSYTAVGATNVGTVKVYCDKTLQTNHPKITNRCKDVFLGSNIHFKKGDPFGEFRMGSTIVLVFEAPVNFHFTVVPGNHLQMGQSLGRVSQKKNVDRVQKSPNQTINKAS